MGQHRAGANGSPAPARGARFGAANLASGHYDRVILGGTAMRTTDRFLTHAGPTLRDTLLQQPLHEMYEESKGASERETLNQCLRRILGGRCAKYPALAGATCDVVFSCRGERVWLEAKLVHSHYGGSDPRLHAGFARRNPFFEKHLGVKDEKGHHSALRDLTVRLPTLDAGGHADRLGLLVVLFDTARFAERTRAEIERFEALGRVREDGWARDVLQAGPDPREVARGEAATISVIYWERRAKAGLA